MDLGPMDAPADAPPFRCAANADCAGRAGGPACDTATGRCVACAAASDLRPAGQYCVAATNACAAGCRDDGADGSVGDDGGVGPGARCEPETRRCVACTADAHCPASTRCVGSTCVTGCVTDAHCAAGQTCCAGGCVDPRSDTAHCGGCGVTCAVAHGSAACAAGACVVDRCAAPYADCDLDPANGCDVDTRASLAHCGGCGAACSPAHATGACASGACGVASCEGDRRDCDRSAANGCEAALGFDPAHCGRCANRCAVVHGSPACAAGACALAACDPGHADCDGLLANGCEADLSSPAACGSTASTPTARARWGPCGSTATWPRRAAGGPSRARWSTAPRGPGARSGVDFSTGLTTAQAAAFGFSLRALDSDGSCFPAGDESAAMVFYTAECCWVNGLGNTPGEHPGWGSHDLSLLRLSRITPVTCTAGAYPCNANGRTISSAGECHGYDPGCKAGYALVWVR